MLFLEKRKRGPVRLNIALFTFNLQAFVSHKTSKSEVWSLIKFIYFLYPPWGKANNKTAKHWAHPLTFGSTDFISTAETGVRLLQPQFYHGRLCISFWLEVKGSGGAEKWRGLLKARAAFLRCSGEHPSSYFTQVGAHRSQSWCTSSAVKKSQRQAAKTAGWKQRVTKHCFKGMRREHLISPSLGAFVCLLQRAREACGCSRQHYCQIVGWLDSWGNYSDAAAGLKQLWWADTNIHSDEPSRHGSGPCPR